MGVFKRLELFLVGASAAWLRMTGVCSRERERGLKDGWKLWGSTGDTQVLNHGTKLGYPDGKKKEKDSNEGKCKALLIKPGGVFSS
jgi:hypothetical protein